MSQDDIMELYEVQAEIIQMREKMKALAEKEKELSVKLSETSEHEMELKIESVVDKKLKLWQNDREDVKVLLKLMEEIKEKMVSHYEDLRKSWKSTETLQREMNKMLLSSIVEPNTSREEHNNKPNASETLPFTETVHEEDDEEKVLNVWNYAFILQILIMGGREQRKPTDKMFILNREQTKWILLPLTLPCPNSGGGSAFLNEEIYIFGGDGLRKQTYKLNKEKQWTQLTAMNEEREFISNSSVVLDGCIWVFGGLFRYSGPLNTVEKYVSEENKWIEMPPMKEGRQSAAAAVCQGKIFVCGGTRTKNFSKGHLKSIECFDPTALVWSFFLNMPADRLGHSMISDGINLIIMGGFYKGKEHNNVWKINPNEENANWKTLKPMKSARWSFEVISLKKEIFAIGGRCNQKVEIFNGNNWKNGPELPNAGEGLSAVVIPRIFTQSFF